MAAPASSYRVAPRTTESTTPEAEELRESELKKKKSYGSNDRSNSSSEIDAS